MYQRFFKRLLDIVLSAMAIVLLSPIFLIITVVVWIQMGTPVFFCQDRIGKNEEPFRLYKFRSMTNETCPDGTLLPENERITRFGKLLRSSSLDELPELFCILVGKMSFVGPRPLPTYYSPYFLPEERKRHAVRGGLIPPDSLSGKIYTTYEEQFRYEVYYAEHVSFLLDVKVILTTFQILWGRVKNGYGSEMDRPHLNVYRNKKSGKEKE